MKTSISVATPADAAALAALRTTVAQEMTARFGEGDWSATPCEPEVVKQVRASRVLVARVDEQIVGTVRLARALPWAIDSSSFTPVTAPLYVLGLAVAPVARGQGIGRELMDAAKQTTREWPGDALWLDAYDHAAGAGPFYLKCGFRQVGRTKHRQMPLIYFEWVAA